MCTKEEQNVMVKAVRKAGWVRSSLAAALTVVTIVLGMWKLGFDFRTEVSDQIDNKIQIHTLESEKVWQEKIHEIQMQQIVVDTKLDTIIERLPE